MNLHVAIIHFPIALLLLYGALEVWRPFAKTAYGFYVKAIVAVAGAVGAWAAVATAPDNLFRDRPDMRPLVHLHEFFGQTTTAVASAVALVYLIAWLSRNGFRPVPWLARICRMLSESGWLVPVALLLIILVTITGALGGAIVFGPDVDPVSHFIYHLFWP